MKNSPYHSVYNNTEEILGSANYSGKSEKKKYYSMNLCVFRASVGKEINA